MRHSLLTIICTCCLAGLMISCQCSSTDNKTKETMTDLSEPTVRIETNFGDITLKLYNKTPKHRDNFIKLVREGYYDGMRFHRVIDGFMIQGGDPNSKSLDMIDTWGQGGPGYTIPAEFVNEYYHKKGAIAAARKGDLANPRKSSSGSQFYIVQDEMNCIHLDGEYTIFGETIEGLDVIDKIAAVQTDPYDRPLEDVMINKIVEIIDEPEVAADSTAAVDSIAATDSTTTTDSTATTDSELN